MIFIPQYAFGLVPDIPDDYFNTPEKLDWSIVFVTSRDNCSSNNEDALNFYASLTRDYLYKFNFSHESFFVDCISKDMMFSVVDKLANYGDLTIVIPDYLMSTVDKHTTNSLGHYGSWIVDTIVSQAETFNIEDRDTAWTLSHELAHFGLNWKGYPHKVMADGVHEVQRMYNACKSYDTTLTNCVYLWDSFNTPSNKGFPVMSPDYVIQVANSMNHNTYSSTIYPTFIIIDSINSQVNYDEYGTISGKILNPDTNQGITNKKLIIKAITPSGSTLVLKNGISDKNGHFSTSLQFNESGTWKVIVNFVGDSQYTSTFSDMASNIIVSNTPQSNNNYGNSGSTSSEFDSDGDGIDDIWDSCTYDSENYNGYLDTDGCPDTAPIPKTNYGEKEQSEIDKSNRQLEIYEENAKRVEKNRLYALEEERKLKDKIEFENQIEDIFTLQFEKTEKYNELREGISTSDTSLKQISPATTQQQELIDKASVLSKMNLEIINHLESNLFKGDWAKAEKDWVMARFYYEAEKFDGENGPQLIGNNLKEISKLIEQSKEFEIVEKKEKTCFLWWCW